MKEQGKHLVKLEQWYPSSKTCHCCGHKVEEMDLSVRKWD
ncbi:zinc ribbon domain-containing protein [Vibrio sp. SG41-7]